MPYRQHWFDLVVALRESNPSLAAILTNSNLVEENETQVKVDVFSKLFLPQLERPESVNLIQQAAAACALPCKKFIFVAGGYGTTSSVELVDEVMTLLN